MESNKWRSNPHFVRMCQLTRQIGEEKLWGAPEKVSDPVYAECEFHHDFLSGEENEALWDFSRLLYVATGEGDPEWNGKNFVDYCQMTWQEMLLRERGASEEELDSLHDQMDEPWYRLNEEEMRLVRLFASLLNLTEKEKKDVECNE